MLYVVLCFARRKIVPETDQCSVTYAEERHAVYFAILTWLGATKRRHTGKQTTIARPILETPRSLGQSWKEERPPNLMTIVTLYNRMGLSRTYTF